MIMILDGNLNYSKNDLKRILHVPNRMHIYEKGWIIGPAFLIA